MADNTTLNPGTAGDVLRSKDRSGVKTPIFALDMNPGGTETLTAAGQQVMASSLSVALASDQSPLGVSLLPTSPTAITLSAADASGIGLPSSTGVPLTGTPTTGSDAWFALAGKEAEAVVMIGGSTVGTLVFEISLDSTSRTTGGFIQVYAHQLSNSQEIAPSLALVNTPGVYRFAIAGAKAFRARCIIGSSPNPVITPVFMQSPSFGQTLLAPNTTGTFIGNVVDNASVDTSPLGTSGITAINTNLLTNTSAWLDLLGSGAARYQSIGVQIIPAAGTVTAGAVTFEQCDDGGNPIPLALTDDGVVGALPISTYNVVASTGRLFSGPLRHRYVRVRVSTGLTGTTTGLTSTWVLSGRPYSANVAVLGTTTLADAIANAAFPVTGDMALLFNNSTWDRQRSNYNTTTGDTGAKTSTFAGAAQTNFNARGALITLVLGAVTGTSPTMTMQVQMSPDGGTNWVNLTGAVTASLTAANASTSISILVYPGVAAVANAAVSAALPRTWRCNFTLGGTPSFTITSVLVAYMN